MIKNYGFKRNEISDPKAYHILGSALPYLILREDGQWGNWLPDPENQFTPNYDTYGCSIYGTENILQILEKYHYGTTNEYDERYNYNIVGINPPGADPHDAAESFRKCGAISGQLPITDTIEEYRTPRPMSEKYLTIGRNFPRVMNHEWVFTNSPNKADRTALLKYYLKGGPLGISVTAWHEQNGVYVDLGQPNTHWIALYGWNDKGWLVFDSYAPFLKVLSYDHQIECCKRYILTAGTRQEQISIIAKLLNLLYSLVGLLKAPEASVATSTTIPSPVPVQPQPSPIPSPVTELKPSVRDFAEAIKVYEGWEAPSAKYPNGTTSWRNKNPGNIKGTDGKFLKFPTEEVGMKYLCNYIKRVQRNEHKAYPKDCSIKQFFLVYAPAGDRNFPIQYGVWVATRLKVFPSYLIKNLV